MMIRDGRARLAAVAALCLGVFACSDDEPAKEGESINGEGSLYAVMYEVFGETDSDSYLSVFDSLDIEELDTAKAREFAGGRAFLQAYNDWVFVGEPSSPTILRFIVDKKGNLKQDGELNLGNYGLNEASIDDWGVNFISPEKAYFFIQETGVTVIWDPSEMEITGEIPAADGYLREGLETSSNPAAVRGDRLYRALYWQESDSGDRSDDQKLLVYDTKNNELVESFDERRCPAPGNRAFVAEDGTIYFSNWIWAVSKTLLKDGPKNCILRILPGEDNYDADWALDFQDITDGREGAMFTYVADGKGIFSVFKDEGIERDDTTDPWEFASNPKWEIWNVDLEARSGEPLKGIPENTGAYTPVKIDGRLFLMVPGTDWDTTQLYEIEDERAEPFVKVPGWSYMFEKIR